MMRFPYNGDYFDGVFKFFRSTNPPSISSIIATSPNSLILNDNFCQFGYRGSYPSALIDGDEHVCWANDDNFREEDQYVVIDFGLNSFILDRITFAGICCNPKKLLILGSNDQSFSEICTLESFSDTMKTNSECRNGTNAYRFIKIQQIGTNVNKINRMHITEIEFFGTLKPSYKIEISCIRSKSRSFNLFTLIMILMRKKS